jgi:hypothetical protein
VPLKEALRGGAVAVADEARRPAENVRELPLALDKRQCPQVASTEVEHIEDEVEDFRVGTSFKRVLQRLKVCDAVRVVHHDLPIEPCFINRKLLYGAG